MPSGERYRITLKEEGIKLDLSPQQFALLSRKTTIIPKTADWVYERRYRGMIERGLLRKDGKTLIRTVRGEAVYTGIRARAKGVAS